MCIWLQVGQVGAVPGTLDSGPYLGLSLEVEERLWGNPRHSCVMISGLVVRGHWVTDSVFSGLEVTGS